MGVLVRPVLLATGCLGLIGLSAKPLSSPVKIIPFESPTLKD
jgi:hypothetical protein